MRGAGLGAGYVADRALGDPERFHPVAGFGSAAARIERVLWRDCRSAGVVHVAVCVVPLALLAAVMERRLARAGHVAFVAALTWAALGGRSLGRIARELAEAVAADDLSRARTLLPSLAGRDPSALDGSELCRAAVESVAENCADAVIGPLLWGTVGGAAGIATYRAANTLDAMIGHRNARYGRFGWAAARLDDVLNWPVARIGAAIATLLAPIAGGDSRRAWRVLRRDGSRHPSPNAGRMEAAFAGALDIKLGGTNLYGTRVEHRPVLGDGEPSSPIAVRRAVRLADAVGAMTAVACALIAWRRR